MWHKIKKLGCVIGHTREVRTSVLNGEWTDSTGALERNGYNRDAICKAFKETGKLSETPTPDDNNHRAFLLYVKGTTDKISSMLRKYGIKTCLLYTSRCV